MMMSNLWSRRIAANLEGRVIQDRQVGTTGVQIAEPCSHVVVGRRPGRANCKQQLLKCSVSEISSLVARLKNIT